MSDQLKWLGKREEIEFEKIKFKGSLAGQAWKYSQCLDGIIRVRAIIILMSLIVFYPIISNYLFHDVFIFEILYERFIFSIAFIIAGLIFNKFRITAIIIASIPLILIILTYISVEGQFDLKRIAFTGAILFYVVWGIFIHLKMKNIRKNLDKNLKENHLIE